MWAGGRAAGGWPGWQREGKGPAQLQGWLATASPSGRAAPGTSNQGVSMPVCLSIVSFMLLLFYCLGMDVHGKCLVLIDYVVRRGLNNGLQKLSRAPPGLIQ